MSQPKIKSLIDFFGKIHGSDFTSWSSFSESSAIGWFGFIFLGLAVTWLTSFSVSHLPEKLEVGMVLKREIRADRQLTIINEEETKQERQRVLESILPIFDYDETIPLDAPQKVQNLLSKPIIADLGVLRTYNNNGLILRRIHPPDETPEEGKEIIVRDFSQILTIEQAKQLVYKSMRDWIVPNATFNLQETELRKEIILRSLRAKTITYQAGDYVMRAGTTLKEEDINLLEQFKKTRGLENRPIRFLGTFLFVALALGATFYFSERFIKQFLPTRKDYMLIGFIIVLVLATLRISLVLIGVLHEVYFYELARTTLYYIIPVAAGVMLVRLFLNAEVSLIVAVILSLLAGLTVGSGINFTTYCLISGIAASSSIAHATNRIKIIKSGLITGLANAFAVLGILLIKVATEIPMEWSAMLFPLMFAFLGGIFASLFAFVATPMLEYLFNMATDIKLMELANLNHPLLKELIVRAPGTYHHSHIVGVLAEAAAEAIGANPLLARVGAYYHDIGKMKKPSYFIENNPQGKNKHENLSPHMSALIIAAHVKEGIALAKAHKLPQKIIDMIPEHHGTKRIGFFYEKAKEQADPNLQQIEEKDFRYPGPKPQTQEAAILMLADGAEATVRSLKEKSAARIRNTVEQLIDRSFAEAELDECDLTLKDLHEIAKAFTRILTALYHQRIDYAEHSASFSITNPRPTEENPSPHDATVHRIKFS